MILLQKLVKCEPCDGCMLHRVHIGCFPAVLTFLLCLYVLLTSAVTCVGHTAGPGIETQLPKGSLTLCDLLCVWHLRLSCLCVSGLSLV